MRTTALVVGLLFAVASADLVRIADQFLTHRQASTAGAFELCRFVHGVADGAHRHFAAIVFPPGHLFRCAELVTLFAHHAAAAAFIQVRHDVLLFAPAPWHGRAIAVGLFVS